MPKSTKRAVDEPAPLIKPKPAKRVSHDSVVKSEHCEPGELDGIEKVHHESVVGDHGFPLDPVLQEYTNLSTAGVDLGTKHQGQHPKEALVIEAPSATSLQDFKESPAKMPSQSSSIRLDDEEFALEMGDSSPRMNSASEPNISNQGAPSLTSRLKCLPEGVDSVPEGYLDNPYIPPPGLDLPRVTSGNPELCLGYAWQYGYGERDHIHFSDTGRFFLGQVITYSSYVKARLEKDGVTEEQDIRRLKEWFKGPIKCYPRLPWTEFRRVAEVLNLTSRMEALFDFIGKLPDPPVQNARVQLHCGYCLKMPKGEKYKTTHAQRMWYHVMQCLKRTKP